jgi:hypothetical protein
MSELFKIDDIAQKPEGWRVRTIIPRGESQHRIRIGFPPGGRHKGAGRLLQILHPKHENPSCLVTPQRAAHLAGEELGIANPAELLVLGANSSQQNPGAELLILGANPGETQQAKAAELYRQFQGKEPDKVLELQRSTAMRKDYTGLADLEALVVCEHFTMEEFETFISDMKHENGNFGRVHKPANTGIITFGRRDKVKLASNPDGTQLYLLGGNQDLSGCLMDLGVDPRKDLIDLGYCICVRYIAEKAQGNFETALYWHILGEDSKTPPRLFYDKLKRELAFAGGEYVVKAPGIIN